MFTSVRGFARGFVADIVIVVFLVACLAALNMGTARQRVIAVGVFAVSVELFQGLRWVGPDSHWLLHLTLGSTFDPWDLVAYALGLGLAALAERAWR